MVVCAISQLTLNASEPSTQPVEQDLPSIQKQLDQLKTGQERLSRQVDEIRTLLEQLKGTPTNRSDNPTAPSVVSANVHGEPFLGTNSAHVAIIEYSDFDCSFCGRYARTVFPRIESDYIQSGKIKYFFRDLPEPGDTNAWFKARAARCAGDQGKFWQMHDLLFANQPATSPEVITLTQTLGLDMREFNQSISSEKYLENIRRSVSGAKRMGLYGTPAFLIGNLSDDGDFVRVNRVLVGGATYDSIKSVLDESLGSVARK
jgi:protein-disulfide isomerase